MSFCMHRLDFTISLLVNIDDILVKGSSLPKIESLIQFLHEKVIVKNLWDAKYFIRLKLYRSLEGIFINQQKFIRDINQDMGLLLA